MTNYTFGGDSNSSEEVVKETYSMKSETSAKTNDVQ